MENENEKREINHEILALRCGEYVEYYKSCPSIEQRKGRIYAFCLLKMPDFPLYKSANYSGLAVVTMSCFKDGWSAVPLSGETKEEIGRTLEDNSHPIGEWIFADVYQKEDMIETQINKKEKG